MRAEGERAAVLADAVAPTPTPALTLAPAPAAPVAREASDHFTERDGAVFAGTHVLLDLWGASRLDDEEYLGQALRRAAEAAGATLLHLHLHRFGEGQGVSGVAVLAESHISVHTWPERGFAAFDVFMCGACRPELAADEIRRALRPVRVEASTQRRGTVTARADG